MPIKKVSKRDIIKSSLEVFRQKGYHSTSMADLAAACGLLKGSIYHHFAGKEDLMLQTIGFLHDHYKRDVFSLADEDGFSGIEKLERLTVISEEIFYNEPGGCLMANIGLETAGQYPEFQQAIKGFFEDWVDCLATIFEEKLPSAKAREIAEYSVAEIEGSVLLMQVYGDKTYLQRTHKHIIEQFVNAGKMQDKKLKNKQS